MRSLIFFQVDFIILLINLKTLFRTVPVRRAIFSSNERIQRRKRRLLRLFNSKTTLLPVISKIPARFLDDFRSVNKWKSVLKSRKRIFSLGGCETYEKCRQSWFYISLALWFTRYTVAFVEIKSTQVQVAQSELNSSKLSVHRQQPNSNVFFKSSANNETARLKLELKTAKEEFKRLAKGTQYENERLDV